LDPCDVKQIAKLTPQINGLRVTSSLGVGRQLQYSAEHGTRCHSSDIIDIDVGLLDSQNVPLRVLPTDTSIVGSLTLNGSSGTIRCLANTNICSCCCMDATRKRMAHACESLLYGCCMPLRRLGHLCCRWCIEPQQRVEGQRVDGYPSLLRFVLPKRLASGRYQLSISVNGEDISMTSLLPTLQQQLADASRRLATAPTVPLNSSIDLYDSKSKTPAPLPDPSPTTGDAVVPSVVRHEEKRGGLIYSLNTFIIRSPPNISDIINRCKLHCDGLENWLPPAQFPTKLWLSQLRDKPILLRIDSPAELHFEVELRGNQTVERLLLGVAEDNRTTSGQIFCRPIVICEPLSNTSQFHMVKEYFYAYHVYLQPQHSGHYQISVRLPGTRVAPVSWRVNVHAYNPVPSTMLWHSCEQSSNGKIRVGFSCSEYPEPGTSLPGGLVDAKYLHATLHRVTNGTPIEVNVPATIKLYTPEDIKTINTDVNKSGKGDSLTSSIVGGLLPRTPSRPIVAGKVPPKHAFEITFTPFEDGEYVVRVCAFNNADQYPSISSEELLGYETERLERERYGWGQVASSLLSFGIDPASTPTCIRVTGLTQLERQEMERRRESKISGTPIYPILAAVSNPIHIHHTRPLRISKWDEFWAAGHRHAIHSIAQLPEFDRVITSSADQTRVWEMSTGRTVLSPIPRAARLLVVNLKRSQVDTSSKKDRYRSHPTAAAATSAIPPQVNQFVLGATHLDEMYVWAPSKSVIEKSIELHPARVHLSESNDSVAGIVDITQSVDGLSDEGVILTWGVNPSSVSSGHISIRCWRVLWEHAAQRVEDHHDSVQASVSIKNRGIPPHPKAPSNPTNGNNARPSMAIDDDVMSPTSPLSPRMMSPPTSPVISRNPPEPTPLVVVSDVLPAFVSSQQFDIPDLFKEEDFRVTAMAVARDILFVAHGCSVSICKIYPTKLMLFRTIQCPTSPEYSIRDMVAYCPPSGSPVALAMSSSHLLFISTHLQPDDGKRAAPPPAAANNSNNGCQWITIGGVGVQLQSIAIAGNRVLILARRGPQSVGTNRPTAPHVQQRSSVFSATFDDTGRLRCESDAQFNELFTSILPPTLDKDRKVGFGRPVINPMNYESLPMNEDKHTANWEIAAVRTTRSRVTHAAKSDGHLLALHVPSHDNPSWSTSKIMPWHDDEPSIQQLLPLDDPPADATSAVQRGANSYHVSMDTKEDPIDAIWSIAGTSAWLWRALKTRGSSNDQQWEVQLKLQKYRRTHRVMNFISFLLIQLQWCSFIFSAVYGWPDADTWIFDLFLLRYNLDNTSSMISIGTAPLIGTVLFILCWIRFRTNEKTQQEISARQHTRWMMSLLSGPLLLPLLHAALYLPMCHYRGDAACANDDRQWVSLLWILFVIIMILLSGRLRLVGGDVKCLRGTKWPWDIRADIRLAEPHHLMQQRTRNGTHRATWMFNGAQFVMSVILTFITTAMKATDPSLQSILILICNLVLVIIMCIPSRRPYVNDLINGLIFSMLSLSTLGGIYSILMSPKQHSEHGSLHQQFTYIALPLFFGTLGFATHMLWAGWSSRSRLVQRFYQFAGFHNGYSSDGHFGSHVIGVPRQSVSEATSPAPYRRVGGAVAAVGGYGYGTGDEDDGYGTYSPPHVTVRAPRAVIPSKAPPSSGAVVPMSMSPPRMRQLTVDVTSSPVVVPLAEYSAALPIQHGQQGSSFIVPSTPPTNDPFMRSASYTAIDGVDMFGNLNVPLFGGSASRNHAMDSFTSPTANDSGNNQQS
jgi:hypothetical protein